MRIVFMGTPGFAVPCLETLIESAYQVVGVITQPDRPKGRGNKIAISPVKERALAYNLPIWQPLRVNTPEVIAQIRDARPDLIVVVAFGQILSRDVLDIPPKGCINVHASLLPKYRGAAPIHWAIINGEQETGVTTMYMDTGMDTGDMIMKEKVQITENDTAGTLHDKLAIAGASLLKDTVQLIMENKAPRKPQDHQEATYAPILKRAHELINWQNNARHIANHIRGMNPWPGAYTTINNRTVKVWEAETASEHGTGVAGLVEEINGAKGIKVQGESGALWLTQVQPEGSKIMSGADFARGYRLEVGTRLGSDIT